MKINSLTNIIGIIGYPIKHTLSPAMHNAAFDTLHLNMVYLPLPIKPDNFEAAVKGLLSLDNLIGLNVTMPYKERVMGLLDEVSPEADALGAVNTVCRTKDKWAGYNTDGEGYLDSLKKNPGIDPSGQEVVIIGAGGACRAVAFSLAKLGVGSLTLINRTVSRAVTLTGEIKKFFGDITVAAIGLEDAALPKYINKARLLINATSLGMKPGDPLPVDPALIHPGLIVSDLIYNPRETNLLKEAKARGAGTVEGIGMFVHQGALAFELWTGQEAPLEIMRQVVEKEL
ncbi:MAG: shikimate dehydrogenase [bacterium]|nr:shikimate dehydrogenase [bacterium]